MNKEVMLGSNITFFHSRYDFLHFFAIEFVFSSFIEENLPDEEISITLDDVVTTRIDFNPSIANTMWFA